MSEDYVGVKIPRSLAEEVDRLIGRHGFTSRAEIVKEALRLIVLAYGIVEAARGIAKKPEGQP